ncbi:hypothetical protein RclHR1_02450010 [Rhizophagus clarus]|uniref:DUF7431 domain-containing protein n=1 Tax=Rhizophagus clarus TaxID=94130 RepID=A0A2Z6QXG6_9GLOM|nr:hypothetical protein RclHR1_02450010 [Rhizophagus clarus]GES99672.1 hypothetical protein GLOIN_2v1472953 [Rhizophagus clarus]
MSDENTSATEAIPEQNLPKNSVNEDTITKAISIEDTPTKAMSKSPLAKSSIDPENTPIEVISEQNLAKPSADKDTTIKQIFIEDISTKVIFDKSTSTDDMNNKELVTVVSNLPSQPSKAILLNLKDCLSTIREELLTQLIINNKSLFLKKCNNEVDEFAEILLKDETSLLLKNIISENVLFVRIYPEWEYFNQKYDLGYGYIRFNDEVKRAEKRAFTIIKGCELINASANDCMKGWAKLDSNEDRTMKINLSYSANFDFKKFINLGVSYKKSKSEDSSLETNISHEYTNYSKAFLNFKGYITPTFEFTNAVEAAVNSNNRQKLLQITEDYGQFVPISITFRGKVYYHSIEITSGSIMEDTEETYTSLSVTEHLDTKSPKLHKTSEKTSKRFYKKYNKIIGGDFPKSLNNFDEVAWTTSLNRDFTTWDIIEFKEIMSIFQILPYSLRKKVSDLAGKKILHLVYKDIDYSPDDYLVRPFIVKLNAPSNILNILENKDADCSIFVTISNMDPSDKDTFNDYQLTVLRTNFYEEQSGSHKIKTKLLNYEGALRFSQLPLLGVPVVTELTELNTNEFHLIGHHFYDPKVKDKIGLCVFCYDIKENRYVELPPLDFNILIIRIFGQLEELITCEVVALKRVVTFFGKYHHHTYSNDECTKFISPIAITNNHNPIGPVYLRQNNKMIQSQHIYCAKSHQCIACYRDYQLSGGNNIYCTVFDPSSIDKNK